MKRQRNRITQFEIRSVQLMAACTLGLAGLAATQGAPASPTAAAKTAVSMAAIAAPTHRGNTSQPLRRLAEPSDAKVKAA